MEKNKKRTISAKPKELADIFKREIIAEQVFKDEQKCGLCKGVGYYQEYKGGPVHTCLTCLNAGRLG
jgi:hypothetical protein